MAYQGEYDWLCGMYAITNAFIECGAGDGEKVFMTACSRLARNRWPTTIWEGTDFDDMKKMIRKCSRQITPRISFSFPFEGENEPESNEDYWHRFFEMSNGKNPIRCGIIQIDAPFSHWIVAKKDGGRVAFVDSSPRKSTFRRNLSSLYAGQRRRKRTQWRIIRSNLIVFRRN